ncbi:Piso0_002674 [Millerozyma farinosa CBS 7064]|uniref:Piso0_002674 protein n=1 Tax=Pichia sorbitophila (strain ATCC MYA-4447 / BCRC 22081 / CBS 7064 / NBRC 10061 / NRRL Y-12695) TaxID=559304 RepID=G8YD81_PICSO|nr:Piso0_002674 [Millerozyma farinosa CBS 7064]
MNDRHRFSASIRMRETVVFYAVFWLTLVALGAPVAQDYGTLGALSVQEVKQVKGINLDLSGIELAVDEQRYLTEMRRSGLEPTPTINAVDTVLKKYEIGRRDDFNARKMGHIVSKQSSAVVLFKDSKTVLVPYSDSSDANSAGTVHYKEYDFKTPGAVRTQYESVLFPATPCLRFGDLGSGSLNIGYTASLSLTAPSATGSLELSSTNLALTLSEALSAQTSLSFTGSYSCSSENGTDVRLFYKVGTIEVEPKSRNFFYNRKKKTLFSDKWMHMKRMKFLFDTTPMYFCATEDKMDLMCDKAGVEFVDENGNTFNSIFNDM